MSSIAAVIERARQPGEMSNRRRFTVARNRAIQKLREFALANPHDYVLELIQAAVANGAVYLDLSIDDDSCTLSYIGGGLHEHELSQLFDFLFASKDRRDTAHVRSLALGVNAALRFAPTRIVIESGDGSARSTRMEVRPGEERVDVGRPTHPISGTYVRIEGMKRGALGKGWSRWARPSRPPELGRIEERCLSLPIPMVLCGEMFSSYGSQRIPRLPNYKRTLTFDEGDLYGTLGFGPGWGPAKVELFTYGVYVQAKGEFGLPEGSGISVGQRAGLGAALCYDRLRKTVDHSGVVEDEVYDNMWRRLLPYVRQLIAGRHEEGVPFRVRNWPSGAELSPRILRELLADAKRVVCVDARTPEARLTGAAGERIDAICAALEAPALLVHPDDVDSLRMLGTSDTHFLWPSLTSGIDAAHLAGPAMGPPRRPWLVEAHLGPRLDREQILGDICENVRVDGDRLFDALGRAAIETRVYVPDEVDSARSGRVELRVCDRRVLTHEVEGLDPGFVVVAEAPEGSMAGLRGAVGDAWTEFGLRFAELVRDAVAGVCRKITGEVVQGLAAGHLRGRAARRFGMLEALRRVVPRLAWDEGGRAGAAARPVLELLELAPGSLARIRDVPLFETLEGRPVSLEGLEGLADACGGVVYGAVAELFADLRGLDRDRILALDAESEAQLIRLLGHAGYVRVDVREVLARAEGVVIRDRSWGLRGTGAGPGLECEAEPGRSDAAPLEISESCELALIHQLVERALGRHPPRVDAGGFLPVDDGGFEDARTVCRREAAAHLCALATRPEQSDTVRATLERLPLFPTTHGDWLSLTRLRELAESDVEGRRGSSWVYGRVSVAPSDDERRAASIGRFEAPRLETSSPILRLDAFYARALARVEPPVVAHAVGASVGEPDESLSGNVDGFRPGGGALARTQVATGLGDADLALVPASRTARIVLVGAGDANRDVRRVELDLADRFGVEGLIRVDAAGAARAASEPRALAESIAEAARRVWERAWGELTAEGIDGPRGPELLNAALRHLDRHVEIHRNLQGRRRVHIEDPTAARFAQLPLFPLASGGMVSAETLLRRACWLHDREDPRHFADEQLAEGCAEDLRRCLVGILDPERGHVSRPLLAAPGPTSSPASEGEGETGVPPLHEVIASWLAALRPDGLVLDRVYLTDWDADGSFAGGMDAVWIEANDPGIRALATQRSPVALARVLLRLYAWLNDRLELVTGSDELAFQAALTEAVASGRLDPWALAPPRTSPAGLELGG